LCAARRAWPSAVTVYGGVYPTYHARDILTEVDTVDIIVRGEGEAVALDLAGCLSRGEALPQVQGITFRAPDGTLRDNPGAPLIRGLDDWRVGWELIVDWDLYQCFGLGRAAIVQFSRGCPHQCSYCGQYQFWSKWRWRSPKVVAAEIGWLHRTYGIGFVDLADETRLPPDDCGANSLRLWLRKTYQSACSRLSGPQISCATPTFFH
jgi:anaerobic magnesium-protoporphyrin IX monomethyl ester cyclase